MVTYRPYRPADLDALFAISLATSDAGSDASHLYADKRLPGLIYSAPYAELAPELVHVAEYEGRVAGFVLGVLHTRRWEQLLDARWWPPLRSRYPNPGLPQQDWSADQRRSYMIHHPERAPADVVAPFPAHFHLNLLPHLQGRGMGGALLSAWTEAHGTHAGHVAVNKGNQRAIRFWQKAGFAEVAPDMPGGGRTIWLGRA